MRTSRMKAVSMIAAALLAASCDNGTGPLGPGQVAVAFRSTAGAAGAAPSPSGVTAASVSVTGTNGTLVIDELWIIVAEFELDRLDDDACPEDDGSCEEFEAPPSFVAVPLDGSGVVAVTAAVEPGQYEELEFEIEDLEDDEDSAAKAQQIAELMAEIRAQFPDWPREASMLVVGTFTPAGGAPESFRVYVEAEVEIEMDLIPPVTVGADGSGSTFTVVLEPGLWFMKGDGSVRDMAQLDYDRTGQVVELEVEIEDGFTEIEHDDDD